MKKTVFILILTLSLLLAACSSDDEDAYDEATDDYTEEEDEEEADVDYYGDDFDYDYDFTDEAPTESGTSGESYLEIQENTTTLTTEENMLSLSLKVDTASYSNVTRYIESGSLPPADAVKTEELINYFSYDTPLDYGDDSPFALYTEVGPSPYDADKYMAYIRVKTEELDKSELPSSSITFLIDTSGSMSSHDKMPLLKESLALLVENLDGDDMVSIVTYAGSSEVLLDSVPGDDHDTILAAIDSLDTGGSTAGADGINTAYALAEKNRMTGGNNRVILCSDGDFNVGISSLDELEDLISEKRDSGIYLSVLGFGTGNLRDDVMETLAANGNGNYSYINSLSTAEKVLVEELGANLFTVAEDVKAQVEFNPDNVKSYRLIGYENRQMTNQEFQDDATDAGEVGAGTDVVILFELELYGGDGDETRKYGQADPDTANTDLQYADELFEVRVRYKDPGESESKQLTVPVTYGSIPAENSTDFGFACSVAAFGDYLRGSSHAEGVSLRDITAMAEDNLGQDENGYREDFLDLLFATYSLER